MPKNPAPKPSRRRLIIRVLAGLLVAAVALVAALPWLASTAVVRHRVVAAANKVLAPATVQLDGLRLSWFGSTRLEGLTLRDPKGKAVARAKSAELNHGLIALAMDGRDLGTLTVEGLDLDVERHADGSIDLMDAFAALTHADPSKADAKPDTPSAAKGPRLTLAVRANGSLSIKAPELRSPIVAESLAVAVDLKGEAEPVAWSAKLLNESKGEELTAVGRIELGGAGDLAAQVDAKAWPWSLSAGGVVAQGRLEGRTDLLRKAGRWASTGDLRVKGLDANGPALAGDTLKLDALGAIWDLDGAAGAWTVRRLDATSPVGGLTARGTFAAAEGASARADAKLDLAKLAAQLPHLLHVRDGLTLRRGEATASVDVKVIPGGQQLDASARLADLVAVDGPKTVTVKAPLTLSAAARRVDGVAKVDRIAAKADFLDAEAAGDPDRGITLSATFDLEAMQAQLRELIDFGTVALAGKGTLSADYRRTGASFAGKLDADVRSLNLGGLMSAPFKTEHAQIIASVEGPAGSTGLPAGWLSGRAEVRSAELGLVASASTKDPTITLAADARGGLAPLGYAGHGRAHVAGRLSGRALDFDDLRVLLRADAGGEPTTMAARGRVDLDAGKIALLPLAGIGPVSIAPGADGLTITGMNTSMTVLGTLALDLAGVDRVQALLTGGAPQGLTGHAEARLASNRGPEGKLAVALSLSSPDFKGPLDGPLALAVGGTYTPAQVVLDELKLVCAYGTLAGAGRVDDLAGARNAVLSGTLAPDWKTVDAILAKSVAPGATARAAFRPFKVEGPLSGPSIIASLKGEFEADELNLRALGVRVGPAHMVAHLAGGVIHFEPIKTKVNGGDATILPDVVIDDGGGLLKLAEATFIRDAAIDEEVSYGLLSFVAPVLDEASRVEGKVSVLIHRAEIPLWGSSGRKAAVFGELAFKDVAFEAGPGAQEILSLVGKPKLLTLKMNQPISLAVADGRVSQSGLKIPIERGQTLDFAGSVGFDKTLKLNASVPIDSTLLGKDKLVAGALAGRKVVVPIGGTVSRPQVDRRALAANLKQLAGAGLKQDAMDLIEGRPGAPGEDRRDSLRRKAGSLIEELGRGRGGMVPR